MLRAEDDALLVRLEDEATFERLWEHAAPGAAARSPRAGGMIALLRERGAGPAIEQARRGDPRLLLARATPARLEDGAGPLPPALVHHLALFHLARARHALQREVSRGAGQDSLDRSLALVLACWLALGREGTYLRSLAGAVIGGALSEADVDRAIEAAAMRGIDAVAALARDGARQRQSAHARALAALGKIDAAISMAGVDGELARKAALRSRSVRDEIAALVIAPLAAEIEDLAARAWKAGEVADVLERALEAWRWAGEEPEIEHFVVRELPRFAWDLYRERRWDDLRSLLRPLEAPSDRLARRIEAEPTELAWAAQCAQVMVFRAELGPTLDAQVALAERALLLCPTLRNARLVLADLLCARAERRIDQPILLRATDAWKDAAADVARANELFPDLKRLPALRERLGRRGAA